MDRWTTGHAERNPHWRTAAATRNVKKLRAEIARCPRCEVCRAPMVAGQVGTHLSCRGAEPRGVNGE